MKKDSEAIMKPEVFAAFCGEVSVMKPSFQYVIGEQRKAKQEGAAALRGSASTENVSALRDDKELDKHSKKYTTGSPGRRAPFEG